MKRPQLVTEEMYHIYNRGVEKRNVFLESRDYLRFIRSLTEFNDTSPASNLNRLIRSKSDFKQRKLLVEILCFCLMPNHYHLLVRQKAKKGITEFMRKLGTGYTNYFNLRTDRVGPLFQGKFKAVHITEESHLLYLPYYIHLNPLDLKMPEWREQRIRNTAQALAFLKSYRWSSYQDYIGQRNFPEVIVRSPTSNNYEKEMREWLEAFDLAPLHEVMLE